jgi:hypothetical protein
VSPPKEVEAGDPHHQAADHATTNTNSHDTAGYPQDNCTNGRCPFGTPCVCGFYASWKVRWAPRRSVGEQLRSRRAASCRMPRLHDGRRDPISSSRW